MSGKKEPNSLKKCRRVGNNQRVSGTPDTGNCATSFIDSRRGIRQIKCSTIRGWRPLSLLPAPTNLRRFTCFANPSISCSQLAVAIDSCQLHSTTPANSNADPR